MPLKLNGSTSGFVALDAPAAAGSNTLVLPTGNGSNGQVLTTNGSGTLSFTTVTSSQWTTSGSDIYYTTGKVIAGATSSDWSRPRVVIVGNPNEATTGAGVLYLQKANGTVTAGDKIGEIAFSTSSSNVGVYAEIICEGDATGGASDFPGRLVFKTCTDGGSSTAERMRIHNTGDVSIGSTSADGRLFVTKANGTTDVFKVENSSGSGNCAGIISTFSSNGNNTSSWHFRGFTGGVGFWYLYGNGTTSYTSDARKKKNVETTRDGYLEDLNKLRVVKYNWITDEDQTPKELGLIAQEVEEVFPGLVQTGGKVSEEDNFEVKVLKGSVLPVMLLKALQEATKRIETLEANNAALEARLSALEVTP